MADFGFLIFLRVSSAGARVVEFGFAVNRVLSAFFICGGRCFRYVFPLLLLVDFNGEIYMRILSGIQPSGKLHIGNYFGMMKPALELQEQGEAYLFIANYHAMTTVSDPSKLKEMTLDVALDFLACGLNPDKTGFFKKYEP